MATTINYAPGGRGDRARRTRANIISACCVKMANGVFRPTVKEIAKLADCSTRSVFTHFPNTDDMYHECLKDRPTREAIIQRATGGYQLHIQHAAWFNLLHTIVYGSPPNRLNPALVIEPVPHCHACQISDQCEGKPCPRGYTKEITLT